MSAKHRWGWAVGGLLVALAGSLCVATGVAAQSGSGSATLVLRGGHVVDPADGGTATALAIRDSVIVAIGTDAEVGRYVGPGTRTVDLHGLTVLPGLSDHHVHLSGIGYALLNRNPGTRTAMDVSGLQPSRIAERIRERAAQIPPGTWILGRGWQQLAWGADTLPKHPILTEAAPRNPVFLGDSDAHNGWVNQAALRLAGIDADTPDPPGGRILRYPDGEPTGVLLERAVELALREVPPQPDSMVRAAFRTATDTLAARGMTDVYDATFLGPTGIANLSMDFGRYLRLLIAEDRKRPLAVRVRVMIPEPSAFADSLLADPDPFRHPSPHVRVTNIKLFSDGVFARRSANLTHPYPVSDPDSTTFGIPRMTTSEIYQYALRALDAGFDIATHAIGDAAVRRVLDVYEAVRRARPEVDPRRLRIEHFSYSLPADDRRAADLGIVLGIQPNFITPFYERYIGKERGRKILPLQTLEELGVHMAGSTDSYSLPRGIWPAYADAVTRASRDGTVWHPEERLSRSDALRMFTTLYLPGGAEPREGRLEAGRAADLVIASGNPLTLPDSALTHVRTRATMLAGRIAFTDGTIRGLPPSD